MDPGMGRGQTDNDGNNKASNEPTEREVEDQTRRRSRPKERGMKICDAKKKKLGKLVSKGCTTCRGNHMGLSVGVLIPNEQHDYHRSRPPLPPLAW